MAQKQEKPALPRDFHQSRLLSLLSDGKAYTIADISIALKLSDPRSVIRNLRRKGYPIGDMWHKAVYGTRYKRYFLRNDLTI
jgi:hypothetical protein